MPDALSKIRSELGAEAIILSTKQLKTGTVAGLFGRRKIEVMAAVDETARKEEPAKQPAKPDQQERILREMQLMKEMIVRLDHVRKLTAPVDPVWDAVRERLTHHEFEQSLIDKWHDEFLQFRESSKEAGLARIQAIAWMRDQLSAHLSKVEVSGIGRGTRIVRLIGPTGVGKTTSIAKLAAEQVLKLRRKVGFITSDTYRIAAVEQLKTYATILNVPLEVVYSPQEMLRAMDRLKECDVVFMDTAGRNFRNDMYVSEMGSLLAAHEPAETYLVLSLTNKYEDMKMIADRFQRFKVDRILFTKMDETSSFGAIFNLTAAYPFKLSYIANGQDVPDDIHLFHPDVMIDSMMGDERDA